MQGVVSKAAFRRQPRCGQQTFTVMSLHINNNFAKKRDIGKKLLLTIRAIMQDEHVDLAACDFNGAAWRQSSGNSFQPTSTLRGGICRHGFVVNRPTYVASSYFQTHMNYGRYTYTVHSQCLEKSWVSIKETRAATMRYGYTWNSSAADMLTDHE